MKHRGQQSRTERKLFQKVFSLNLSIMLFTSLTCCGRSESTKPTPKDKSADTETANAPLTEEQNLEESSSRAPKGILTPESIDTLAKQVLPKNFIPNQYTEQELSVVINKVTSHMKTVVGDDHTYFSNPHRLTYPSVQGSKTPAVAVGQHCNSIYVSYASPFVDFYYNKDWELKKGLVENVTPDKKGNVRKLMKKNIFFATTSYVDEKHDKSLANPNKDGTYRIDEISTMIGASVEGVAYAKSRKILNVHLDDEFYENCVSWYDYSAKNFTQKCSSATWDRYSLIPAHHVDSTEYSETFDSDKWQVRISRYTDKTGVTSNKLIQQIDDLRVSYDESFSARDASMGVTLLKSVYPYVALRSELQFERTGSSIFGCKIVKAEVTK